MDCEIINLIEKESFGLRMMGDCQPGIEFFISSRDITVTGICYLNKTTFYICAVDEEGTESYALAGMSRETVFLGYDTIEKEKVLKAFREALESSYKSRKFDEIIKERICTRDEKWVKQWGM